MRLRNIKGASDIIAISSYILKDYKDYKGKFKDLFGNENPIHLEIGMGKGDFIINMAINNPDINFIGIEKYDSVIVRALDKINANISNLILIRADAEKIEEILYKEVDTLYLNFSDPWPKNKHSKRRLSSIYFLKKYDNIFKNKKNIVMKTDNRKFFEYSLVEFVNYDYKIIDISLDLHNDIITNNIETEYEKKFVKLGFPIYKVSVIKDK